MWWTLNRAAKSRSLDKVSCKCSESLQTQFRLQEIYVSLSVTGFACQECYLLSHPYASYNIINVIHLNWAVQ